MSVEREQFLDAQADDWESLRTGLLREGYTGTDAPFEVSQRFATAVLDALTAHVAVLGPTGRIVAVNAAWRKFAESNGGLAERLCEGANYFEACVAAGGDDADCATEFLDGIRRVMSGDLPEYGREYPCHAPTEQRWFVGRVTPFAAEWPGHVVVAHTEVTRRKLAEIAQVEGEQRFRATFEQAAVGLGHMAPDGRWLRVNDRLSRIAGYSRDELVAMTVSQLVHPDDLADHHARCQAALTGPSSVFQIENRYARKDGSVCWVSVTGSLVRDAVGEPDYFVLVVEEIGERRRMIAELARYRDELESLVDERTAQLTEAHRSAQAASEAKAIFLANMSHELRTPMNGVIGMVDVLEASRLSRDQVDAVKVIRQSGLTLLGLIEQVLDFTRIEAGRLEISRSPVDLRQLVEDLGESMAPAALRGGVDLHVHVAPDLPTRIVADELRLRQVLHNVLDNAIKFSSGRLTRRGKVALRVYAVGGEPHRLAFEVTDDGVGMDAATLRKLFKPFSQAESSTTRRYGGAGMGLAVCHRLVELMEGNIRVHSQPGCGTICTMEMPVQVASFGLSRSPD